MANRIQRLLAERIHRTEMCRDLSPDKWPNPPCGRCAVPLSNWWGNGYTSIITEHSFPNQEARMMKLDLCPTCYDALIAWLDTEM